MPCCIINGRAGPSRCSWLQRAAAQRQVWRRMTQTRGPALTIAFQSFEAVKALALIRSRSKPLALRLPQRPAK